VIDIFVLKVMRSARVEGDLVLKVSVRFFVTGAGPDGLQKLQSHAFFEGQALHHTFFPTSGMSNMPFFFNTEV
jgi:hypothetical protein